MTATHLTRIGLIGHVGRFRAVDAAVYPRGSRVICRTARGLEIGEILSHDERQHARECDGDLLRGVTVEDDLLLARLQQKRNAAFENCSQLLAERGIPALLIDVEHLFDGESLYFYFLGEAPAEATALTDELAAAYETQVRFAEFAAAVELGCGPGCGTEEAAGCGSSCGTCALVGACGGK